QVAAHATADPAVLERCYSDLLRSLDRVLKVANFTELAHAEIGDAHDRRAVLRVAVNAKLGDFREVRFYRRGHHKEVLEAAEWFGWRRRKIEIDVYDDVVRSRRCVRRPRLAQSATCAGSSAAKSRPDLCCRNASATSPAATSRRCFRMPV